MSESLATHLIGLELELHNPATRSDGDRLDGLLSPDFREFGASGQAWTRAGIVNVLAGQKAPTGETPGCRDDLLPRHNHLHRHALRTARSAPCFAYI